MKFLIQSKYFIKFILIGFGTYNLNCLRLISSFVSADFVQHFIAKCDRGNFFPEGYIRMPAKSEHWASFRDGEHASVTLSGGEKWFIWKGFIFRGLRRRLIFGTLGPPQCWQTRIIEILRLTFYKRSSQ